MVSLLSKIKTKQAVGFSSPAAIDLDLCFIYRHEKERQYVSTLADIVENTQAFRGSPMAWIRNVFCGAWLYVGSRGRRA